LQVLQAFLTIFETFVNTVTDVEIMGDIVEESIVESLQNQVDALTMNLPLGGLELISQDAELDFNALQQQLKDILIHIQATDLSNGSDVLAHVETLNELAPTWSKLNHVIQMLSGMRDNDLTAVAREFQNTLATATGGEAFLDPAVTVINEWIVELFSYISDPLDAIAVAAGDIGDFLKEMSERAGEGAQAVADQIETNIAKVNDLILQVELEVRRIEDRITDYIEQVDISHILDQGKAMCVSLSQTIESFFGEVQNTKVTLERTITDMAHRLDEDVADAFAALEEQIRDMLQLVVDQLERPDVKEALDAAREGIETFKTQIDEASLQPVFDLVIEQTNALEDEVKAIDTSTLGMPQKVAIKVGSKIIEAVKVDEILKPELMEAFEEIQEPIAQLVELLEEKFLIIDESINSFNPGTIATDLILNSEPYQWMISTLESLKPSTLLEPLKQAYYDLLEMAEQFNPDLLVNEVQKIYDDLTQLVVDVIDPEPLQTLISDSTRVAHVTLVDTRDNKIPEIKTTIQERVSLTSLLAGTGIEDITDSDIWTDIKWAMSGAYLDDVDAALMQAKNDLIATKTLLNSQSIHPLLEQVTAVVNRQLLSTATQINGKFTGLQQQLRDSATERQALTELYNQVLQSASGSPDLKRALERIDITLLNGIATGVDDTVSHFATTGGANENSDVGSLAAQLNAVKNMIITEVTGVEDPNASFWTMANDELVLDKAQIDNLPETIFDYQIKQPIDRIIKAPDNGGDDKNFYTEIQPIKPLANNIELILQEIENAPARIDELVKLVLDSLEDNITLTLTTTIHAVDTFEDALNGLLTQVYDKIQEILDELSPTWLLNYFVEEDFADTQLLEIVGNQLPSVTAEAVSIPFTSEQDLVEEAQQQALRDILTSLDGNPVNQITITSYTAIQGKQEAHNLLWSELRAFNLRQYIRELADSEYRDQLRDTKFELQFQGGLGADHQQEDGDRYVDITVTSTPLPNEAEGQALSQSDAKGLLPIAIAMIQPGSDSIAAALSNQYTETERGLLKSRILTSDGRVKPISESTQTALLIRLNQALKDATLCSDRNINLVQNIIDQRIGELEASTIGQELPETDADVEKLTSDISELCHKQALQSQLIIAKSQRDNNNPSTIVRANRILMEAYYGEHIEMSMQSLFPFILQQASTLYPDQLVVTLDETHASLVEQIANLPIQLIKEPLDDEFNRVRQILFNSFDIASVFTSLNLKIDVIDEDLELGLDRLSVTYRQLLSTFEQVAS
jgi:hypothetical protein